MRKNMFPVGKLIFLVGNPKLKGYRAFSAFSPDIWLFSTQKSDLEKVKLFYILEFGLAPPYILKTRTDGTQWCRPSLYFGLRPFFNICSSARRRADRRRQA
ncbi:MAG: hypothetical protein IKW44_03175, partial [Bacteroidaceae bacterium]|nr:hypothetical protein [Bacteroidaceae bacterium]